MKATNFLECERIDRACEAQGIKAMTTVDLLAMVMNRGAVTLQAQQEARDLLHAHGESLRKLRRANSDSMQQVHGIGEYKSRAVQACLELANRLLSEEYKVERLQEASEVYRHMLPLIGDIGHEEMWCILLNHNFNIIKTVRLSKGGITETACDVRLLMVEALKANATAFALAHNHPSGNTTPSVDDGRLTESVAKAAKVMRLHFLDHVIVTENDYYSFRENGRL